MPSSEVRGQDENGEPFFCGKDVCDALGYKRAYDAIRQHVNHGDTAKRSITKTVKNQYGESSKTKKVEMLFVNESGGYSLVFGSKLESAQRFKHWVTSEVLHAIRKNGGYFHINPDETPEQIKARFQKVLEEAIAERDKVIVSLEILPERSVHALRRVCSHGTCQESHEKRCEDTRLAGSDR